MVSAPGEWRKYFRDAPNERGDEQVGRLHAHAFAEMDARSVERMQQAIRLGLEGDVSFSIPNHKGYAE
jgi:hypothetical protein